MRVVAGSARGRKLTAPAGDAVRPTTDRVREAVFNALGSLGAIHDAEVLDLFAGSGAMGIEALSRGAGHCTFVDSSHEALRAIRDNVAACDLVGRSTIKRTDVLRGASPLSGSHFDLAILDPPYGFEDWHALLGDLDAALVVIESNREVELPPGWTLVRARSYGTTVVTIAEADSATEDPDDPPGGEDNP